MDANITLNITSLAISCLALAASAFLAVRQLRTAEGANHVPIVIDFFNRSHDEEFMASSRYLQTMSSEHEFSLGLSGLPHDLERRVRVVLWFYDDLGKLVAHKIVSEQLVIGSFGASAVRAWMALGPYVYAERENRAGTRVGVYFEDLAARATSTSASAVHRRIGLRPRPPANRLTPSA